MTAELAGAAALAIWVYLLFARGGFWLEFRRQAPAPPPLEQAPAIVAVIPARNEAPLWGRPSLRCAANGMPAGSTSCWWTTAATMERPMPRGPRRLPAT